MEEQRWERKGKWREQRTRDRFIPSIASCSRRYPNRRSQACTFKVQDCQNSFRRSLRRTGGIVKISAVSDSSVRQSHQGMKICRIKIRAVCLRLWISILRLNPNSFKVSLETEAPLSKMAAHSFIWWGCKSIHLYHNMRFLEFFFLHLKCLDCQGGKKKLMHCCANGARSSCICILLSPLPRIPLATLSPSDWSF